MGGEEEAGGVEKDAADGTAADPACRDTPSIAAEYTLHKYTSDTDITYTSCAQRPNKQQCTDPHQPATVGPKNWERPAA